MFNLEQGFGESKSYNRLRVRAVVISMNFSYLLNLVHLTKFSWEVRRDSLGELGGESLLQYFWLLKAFWAQNYRNGMPTASAHFSNVSLIWCSETQQTWYTFGHVFDTFHIVWWIKSRLEVCLQFELVSVKLFALSCRYASWGGKSHTEGGLRDVKAVKKYSPFSLFNHMWDKESDRI